MRKWILSVFMSLALFGCATTTDYQGTVNTAQVTNTSVLKLIGIAAESRLISQKDGQNLLKQVDTAQDGINVANSMPAGTAQADKLKQSRAILTGIIEYLNKQGVK